MRPQRGGGEPRAASAPALNLDAIPLTAHETAMRLAIAAAKANPFYPFGAVIVGAADRAVLAQGVNNGKANPILHGEIVAISDYIARHGNQGWADGILYTTGEPCPMCMSAIVWAGISGVVYGSSIYGAGGGRHCPDHDRRERGARRCTLLSRPGSWAASCKLRPTRCSATGNGSEACEARRARDPLVLGDRTRWVGEVWSGPTPTPQTPPISMFSP